MFGLMLKSTHEKAMSDRLRAQSDRLRAQIEEMTPDYELGKQRRAQYQKDNAKRKERREAKRAGV